MAIAVFLIPACGEDDPIGGGSGNTTGPTVSLLADTDVLSEDTTLAPDESFTVRLNAISGESDMNSLKITEDGFDLPTDRFSIAGIAAVNNPQLISGDDRTSFTWDITIIAQSSNNSVIYEFEVTDANGEFSRADILISTEVAAGDVLITYNGPATVTTTPGAINNFNFDIDANGNTLSSIAVYEDGVLVDPDRLRFPNVMLPNNPQLLTGDDANGFSGDIGVEAISGTHTLTFEVTTATGTKFTQDVVYNAGTDLSGEYTARIVYNADGPFFGGLDLDTGEVVSVNDAAADIIDSGLDQSGPTVVWNQTIEPANGASLRILNDNTMETFSYESVISKEAIAAAYNDGQEISVSGTVEVGDIFVANANGVNYLLVVRDVRITTNDNEDSYTFDVKF